MLTTLPNIGKTLAYKLNQVGINTPEELIHIGSENTIIRLDSLEESGACIHMFYAIEGAIQGIRWHGLDAQRKMELRNFFQTLHLK